MILSSKSLLLGCIAVTAALTPTIVRAEADPCAALERAKESKKQAEEMRKNTKFPMPSNGTAAQQAAVRDAERQVQQRFEQQIKDAERDIAKFSFQCDKATPEF